MTGKTINYWNRLIWMGAGIVLCLLLLSAYSNTLYTPFVLDDLHSFVNEPKVLGFTFNLAGLENLAASKFGLRRILPMLTFVFDLKWGNGSPAAFHVTNIVIHLLATCSLFFLLQSLFLLPKFNSSFKFDKNCNSSTLMVFFIVGLWSLNPVQTNAVSYVVQRMTSMATLFYFLSFGFYLRGRSYHLVHGFAKITFFLYLCSLFSFICAMLSKEIAATLPVMLLLVEWLLVEDSGLFVVLKKYRILVSGLGLLALIVIGYKFYHSLLLGGYAHRHFTLSERLLTELRIVVSYCGLLLLPLPRWLNLEHDVALSTSLFSPSTTFFSLIFIILVVGGAWKIRGKKPLITFAAAWFFINLLIESTVIPLELKFEHRLYLPSAGFYLAVVLLLRELYIRFYGNNLSPDRIKILVSVMVVICSALSFLTYTRNLAWSSTISLYQDCLVKAPAKARTHSNLATAWLKAGEYEKGLHEAEKALSLGVKGYEEYWVAASDIVAGLVLLKKYDEAISRGEILLTDAPLEAKKNSYPLFLFKLGMAYFNNDEFQSAFDYFLQGYKFCYENDFPEISGFESSMAGTLKAGLEQDSQFDSDMKLDTTKNQNVAVNEKMAQIFFGLHNYDLALQYVEKALAQGEKSETAAKVKEEIAQIFASNERQKKMGTLKEKYLYHPFASRFHLFMALAFALEKYDIHLDGFLQYCLRQAETLNNSSPDLYIVKSWYFYKMKDYDKALKIIDQGIKLKSDYAHLWVNRGIYALAAGSSDAYSYFDKALTLYPGYPHREKILEMQRLAERQK